MVDEEKIRTQIEEKRQEMNQLNGLIIEFLNARQMKVFEIVNLKRQIGMQLRIPEREAEMIRNIAMLNKGPMKFEAVEDVFKTIFKHSLDNIQ